MSLCFVVFKEWVNGEICIVVILEMVCKFIVLGVIVVVEVGVGLVVFLLDVDFIVVGV